MSWHSADDQVRVIRGGFRPNAKVLIARGYGKRNTDSDEEEVYGLENFWEMLESPEGEDKQMESIHIPVDWFLNELMNNPDFARAVVRKFINLNQDGNLSADELLRNVV